MWKKITGLVVRTVFNNQGWAGPCKNPLKDYRCFKCVREGGLYINQGNPINEDERGFCKGEVVNDPKLGDLWCWEQTLCTKYFWRNVLGEWRHARDGMPVYFVFSEPDRSLTLWGMSVINKIDSDADYPALHFEPFKPLPEDKWVRALSGEKLTGSHWKQLHYRYLDENHETYLTSLILGRKEFKPDESSILPLETKVNLNIQLSGNMKEKLEKISNNEGREIDEIIREALAKLIRDRGF